MVVLIIVLKEVVVVVLLIGSNSCGNNSISIVRTKEGHKLISRLFHLCRWGIEAGFTATVTFLYLSRQLQWEKKLTAEMYPMLVPSEVPF